MWIHQGSGFPSFFFLIIGLIIFITQQRPSLTAYPNEKSVCYLLSCILFPLTKFIATLRPGKSLLYLQTYLRTWPKEILRKSDSDFLHCVPQSAQSCVLFKKYIWGWGDSSFGRVLVQNTSSPELSPQPCIEYVWWCTQVVSKLVR